MSIIEIILVAIGISMDVFAIAMSKGLALQNAKSKWDGKFFISFSFAFFQSLMPLIGYYLIKKFAHSFSEVIEQLDHWIIFTILLALGLKMFFGSKETKETSKNTRSFRQLESLRL